MSNDNKPPEGVAPPITPKFKEFLNKLAKSLDDMFLKISGQRQAWLLLQFDNETGRTNYISNIDRAVAVEQLKIFLADQEAFLARGNTLNG